MSPFQREISATINTGDAGQWQVIARPMHMPSRDISFFRGAPIQIGDFSFTDPFGPGSMTITFPQVSFLDALGQGDLSWMVKHTDIDVKWIGPLPASYPFGSPQIKVTRDSSGKITGMSKQWLPDWRWEGYIASFSWDNGGLTVQMKGSLLQLDNYLAKPEFASRPMPYEWAIQRQFLHRPSLRLLPLRIEWPKLWGRRYTPPAKGTPSYQIPAGVTPGANWTALLTRNTGNWDPVLTSYIQTLLQSMYTQSGRWSLDLDANRQPVLMHRYNLTKPGSATVVIDPIAPGVKLNLTEDWEQTLTTIYGQGTGRDGVVYSGMEVSADGTSTSYEPLAAARQVYPTDSDNDWFDSRRMAKEVMVQMQEGLDSDDAAVVARDHLTRFADPGVTGTIILSSDPSMGGEPMPRHLVRAGMSIQVLNLFGRPEGMVMHVSESTHSLATGSTTLTVDSKFRDSLTVEEVRQRGRDALSISRMLIAGQYQPPVPDQLLPWSYSQGSGFIPSNKSYSAVKLFSGMPKDITFPWTEWTTKRPPINPKWRSSYLNVGPAQPDATDNWFVQHNAAGDGLGSPIRMAQAGTIRLVQIAAYDDYGNVLKVPFHVSFYYVAGVNPKSMPKIPAEQQGLFPPYRAGQPYPFVRDGFEAFNRDGTKTNPKIPHPTDSVGLLRAYGTYYEKAGYWPGSYSTGDAPTGMLVDEASWTFDCTGVGAAYWDPYDAERNLTNPLSGNIYAMIYCDAQGPARNVYFLGRIFRSEPGSGV